MVHGICRRILRATRQRKRPRPASNLLLRFRLPVDADFHRGLITLAKRAKSAMKSRCAQPLPASDTSMVGSCPVINPPTINVWLKRNCLRSPSRAPGNDLHSGVLRRIAEQDQRRRAKGTACICVLGTAWTFWTTTTQLEPCFRPRIGNRVPG